MSTKGLVLSQITYALEMILELGLSGCKEIMTPMELNLNLTSKTYDEHLGINQQDLLLQNPNAYRELDGKLLYLSITSQSST